jgi:predicted dehydrogenase
MDWGLAGYGDLSERRLASALSGHGHRLLVVWGRDPKRAQAFAKRHNIPQVAVSLDDLCRNVEAIYVATPVASHVEIAEAALLAGRDVLVEKPISPGLGSAAHLPALAAATGRTAAAAYYRRLAPALRLLRDLISGGSLGEPRQIEFVRRSPFDPGPSDPKRWRLDPRVAGAGVLADVGSHALDLLIWLFGKPRDLAARLGRFTADGAERRADVEILWASGLVGRCTFEWASGPPEDRIVIHCSDGHVAVDPLDRGRLHVRVRDRERVVDLPTADNPHLPLIEDFAAASALGLAPACPLVEGIWTDLAIEAALRSHARGGVPEPLGAPTVVSGLPTSIAVPVR